MDNSSSNKSDLIEEILVYIEKSECLLRQLGVRVAQPMIFKSLNATREMLENKPESALAQIHLSTRTFFTTLKSLSQAAEHSGLAASIEP